MDEGSSRKAALVQIHYRVYAGSEARQYHSLSGSAKLYRGNSDWTTLLAVLTPPFLLSLFLIFFHNSNLK